MRFIAPTAYSRTVSRHNASVPPDAPSLRGLSQTLEGLILTEPCGLVSCHIRSWGFAPQGFSLPQTPPGSSPFGTLSTFPSPPHPRPKPRLRRRVAPPGLCIPRQSVTTLGIFRPRMARYLLELFIPPLRLSLSPVWKNPRVAWTRVSEDSLDRADSLPKQLAHIGTSSAHDLSRRGPSRSPPTLASSVFPSGMIGVFPLSRDAYRSGVFKPSLPSGEPSVPVSAHSFALPYPAAPSGAPCSRTRARS